MRRDRAAAPDWTIRCATRADLAAVLELWGAADARPSATDSIESLRTLLAADAQALLVADARGALVGSLIAAWNGWRGSLYRLAVRPDQRRRGLATLAKRVARACATQAAMNNVLRIEAEPGRIAVTLVVAR